MAMPATPETRSRMVPGPNGLDMHILEAGFDPPGRPLVLLLHGFPELAFSWRHVLPALAGAGFHAVAPDQRGYGRTTGWDAAYDGDLGSFRMTNLVRDALGLVWALGHEHAAAVVGHDFGSPVAAWCALIRPDVFRAAVLMSAPFDGPPARPFRAPRAESPDAALARLDPPRKHYVWYYATPEANADLWRCPQGVHAFLRAYFHMKSGDWPGNRPYPLAAWTAEELAKLPAYYVMDRNRDMAATVADEMPPPSAIAACAWLPEDALRVYSAAFERTGFQGGLNWYRCRTEGVGRAELEMFSGRPITVPSLFIAGARDWGVHQTPGGFDRMRRSACPAMRGAHLVDGAGHWVQQERPEQVNALLLRFLAEVA
jgi:pimeloyl-ACP methyl ester carboxylesterase